MSNVREILEGPDKDPSPEEEGLGSVVCLLRVEEVSSSRPRKQFHATRAEGRLGRNCKVPGKKDRLTIKYWAGV